MAELRGVTKPSLCSEAALGLCMSLLEQECCWFTPNRQSSKCQESEVNLKSSSGSRAVHLD